MSDLTRIFEILDKLRDDQSLNRETVNVMANQLTDLHKTIQGNGKPGLVKNFADHCQEDRDWRWRIFITIGLVAAAGSTSGIMFFEMLKRSFGLLQLVK